FLGQDRDAQIMRSAAGQGFGEAVSCGAAADNQDVACIVWSTHDQFRLSLGNGEFQADETTVESAFCAAITLVFRPEQFSPPPAEGQVKRLKHSRIIWKESALQRAKWPTINIGISVGSRAHHAQFCC